VARSSRRGLLKRGGEHGPTSQPSTVPNGNGGLARPRGLVPATGPRNGARASRPAPDAVTQVTAERHSLRPTGEEDSASAAPPLDDRRVEAAKRGDPSSWEAAYLVYGKALMGYLTLRLENREDAADALSETFVRAIDRARGFRGDAFGFRAWLFTIARNVSTDQYRRRARVVVIPERLDFEDRGQPSSEDRAILNEDVEQLRKGFSRLSPADQEILWLRICSGLSASEVGSIVGKRAGAVRMQQMRALEALRGQL